MPRYGYGHGYAVGGGDVRAAHAPTLVATRTGFPSRTVSNTGTTGGGTATQYQQSQSALLTTPARYVTLRFTNLINNSGMLSQLDNGLASLTLRTAIQLSSGLPIPAYLASDGVTRDVVIAPGASVDLICDLGSELVVPSRLWIIARGTFASIPARWPTTDILMTRSDEFNEFGTALTDRSTARWTSGTRTTNYSILPPVAIFASLATPAKSVLILGDSISSAGNNDSTFGDGVGYVQRALNTTPRIAWSDDGAAGMTLSAFIASSAQKTLRIGTLAGSGATHILCPLGTNDLSGGSTAAQLQTNMQALQAYATGLKVIPCTLPPRTNPANDAKYGADSANVWTYRQTYNAWVRTNPFGYGYFDTAAYFEDGTTSLWRTDLGTPTDDGIHPNTVLHNAATTALAAALPSLLT